MANLTPLAASAVSLSTGSLATNTPLRLCLSANLRRTLNSRSVSYVHVRGRARRIERARQADSECLRLIWLDGRTDVELRDTG